jgi:prophage antirepressor-like protein
MLDLALTWEGHRVRMAGTAERPEWIAKDVCHLLHLRNTAQALSDAGVVTSERGISRADTPGGPQDVTTVTEAGLWKLVIASRKPVALRFKQWLAECVLPCLRKHGCYPAPVAPPASALGLFRQTLEALETHERQLAEQGARLARIEARHEVAETELRALPAATKPAPAKSDRAALNERVRAWGAANGGAYSEAWSKLRHELLYRCHFDAAARSVHSGRSWLDEVEAAGLMATLYAIACETLAEVTA